MFLKILTFLAKTGLVYFRSSLRAQTAKTLICTKSGVSADSRKSAKICAKSAENRTFCANSAHFLRKKCGFPHFLALFLESAETPLFVQINVFAVWALRLDRKYTKLDPQEMITFGNFQNTDYAKYVMLQCKVGPMIVSFCGLFARQHQ